MQATAEYKEQDHFGGRLTGCALPGDDSAMERLSEAQRDELALIWLGRAASERRMADAFVVVRDALEELGSRPELIARAADAIEDEFRHTELARKLASYYACRELQLPARTPLAMPERPGATPRLLCTLHILGHCAVNQAFASAFFEVSLNHARSPLARAVLWTLLSDEIDHACLGRAHLAELSQRERTEIIPWLSILVRANLKMWRESERLYPPDPLLHEHGAPPANAVEQALLTAIGEIIIPELEHFDMPTRALRTWLAAGAPTDTHA